MRYLLAPLLVVLVLLPPSVAATASAQLVTPTKAPFKLIWYGLHERGSCYPHNSPCGFEGLRMVAIVHNTDPDLDDDDKPVVRVTSMTIGDIVMPINRTMQPGSFTYLVSDALPLDRDWSKVEPKFSAAITQDDHFVTGLNATGPSFAPPAPDGSQGFWVTVRNDRRHPVSRIGVSVVAPVYEFNEKGTDIVSRSVFRIWWYERDVALPAGGSAQVWLFDYLHSPPIPPDFPYHRHILLLPLQSEQLYQQD